jgi:hypothetical protein
MEASGKDSFVPDIPCFITTLMTTLKGTVLLWKYKPSSYDITDAFFISFLKEYEEFKLILLH